MYGMTMPGWTFDCFYPSINTFEFEMIAVPDIDSADSSSDERSVSAFIHQQVPCATVKDTSDLNSLAFRTNAKDCFLPQSTRTLESDLLEVPDADESCPDKKEKSTITTINVIHHHYAHIVRPVFVAPLVRRRRLSKAPQISKEETSAEPRIDLIDPIIPVGPQDNSTGSGPSSKVKGLLADNGPICTHCSTEATSLWRRIDDKLMCNACALYFKLHGHHRPLHLSTGVIKRRNRVGANVVSKRYRRYRC